MAFDLPDVVEASVRASLTAGDTLFQQGQPCKTYYILLEGSIRVFARSPSGREIVLYRVCPGDICVLTTSCMLSGSRYPADPRDRRESGAFRNFLSGRRVPARAIGRGAAAPGRCGAGHPGRALRHRILP